MFVIKKGKKKIKKKSERKKDFFFKLINYLKILIQNHFTYFLLLFKDSIILKYKF